ncbi:hypothetical protein GUITHDRAFT_48927, partial [Guillardia theta CCMP2712]
VYFWGQAGSAVGEQVSSSTPRMLKKAMGRQVRDVACGLVHSAMVMGSGEVLCWGENKYGQCGTGTQEQTEHPTFVGSLFGVACMSVSCGGAHTVVVSEDGRVFSWGLGANGQLGHGSRDNLTTPSVVQAMRGRDVLAVTCGVGHTVIVLAGGELYTCGWNKNGQCGVGSTSDLLSPQCVESLRGEGVQHASCGAGHTAVVTGGGEVFTFGSGSCGQLGHGDCQDLSMPRRVGALVGIVMSMVACGEEYTVCAAFDHRVFGFGLNNVGQLGASSTSHPYLSEPRQMEFLKEEEVELCKCNQSEVIALTRRGALRAWG